MATGGPLSPQPGHPVTSPTDCPLCGSLCLGPVILPCRDVICRRCLHGMLQERGLQLACQQCGHHLDLPKDRRVTVSDLVQQFGTDPFMDYLVFRELKKATDVRCRHCPNKRAVNVCLDCQEFYCDVCSGIHCRSRVSCDHVLHELSQALHNSPAAARATPTSSPGSCSSMSTSSLDSIRNLPDPQSRDACSGVNEWKEWVKKQSDLLQKASREKLREEIILQDILSLTQELLNGVLTKEQVLKAYRHSLSRFDAIQHTDTGTYVIRSTDSDVSTEVKTESLEGRLCGVRQGRHCPDLDTLEMIRTQLGQLLHLADHEGVDPISTAAAGSPTSSSTHSPIAPLPPAIPATTPTFTLIVNVMRASPRHLFTTSPTTADDRRNPGISSIVCLPDDSLVMADFRNHKVKVMDMAPPHTVSASLTIKESAWGLALLSDGLHGCRDNTSSPDLSDQRGGYPDSDVTDTDC